MLQSLWEALYPCSLVSRSSVRLVFASKVLRFVLRGRSVGRSGGRAVGRSVGRAGNRPPYLAHAGGAREGVLSARGPRPARKRKGGKGAARRRAQEREGRQRAGDAVENHKGQETLSKTTKGLGWQALGSGQGLGLGEALRPGPGLGNGTWDLGPGPRAQAWAGPGPGPRPRQGFGSRPYKAKDWQGLGLRAGAEAQALVPGFWAQIPSRSRSRPCRAR